jgi:hypothetical protein
MTLPRVTVLMEYWRDWPPLHVIVNPLLAFMGCKPVSPGAAGGTALTDDNAGLLADLEGAGFVPG